MPYVPIVGFAPDADPTTPGVLTECDGWIPSPRGLHTGYTASDAGAEALASACKGLYISRRNDNTTALFAATATRLYALSSGTWDDRSPGAYSSATAWRFATQGNITLAASLTNKLQAASGDGDFALVTNGGTDAPKASVICTSLGFVMLGNYDDGTAYVDGWFCSALQNYLDWAPAVSTQCANGRLLDTPGPITAMRTLNETVIAFKERAVYQGTYQGPPVIWSWRLLSSDVGATGQEAVVDLYYALAWLGYDGIWLMGGDGVPQRIDGGIREWLFGRIDYTYLSAVKGLYDRQRQLVYWWYPTRDEGSGALEHYVCYNLQTKRWGAGSVTIEWAAETLSTSETYATYFDGFSTWDSIPDTTYDFAGWFGSVPYTSVVNSSHKLAYLGGAASTSTARLNRFGDEAGITFMRRVAPRWTRVPTAATLACGYVADTGDAMTDDTPVTMASNRFDLHRSARWHDFELSTTGDAEFSGLTLDYRVAGRE